MYQRYDKHKKAVKVAAILLGALTTLLLASFIPTLSLKTIGMHELHGSYTTVYYENHKDSAQAVLDRVDKQGPSITQKLGFNKPPHLTVYIYDSQKTFLVKKYGYVTLLLTLDWYVGDNKGTNVMLTSPANPGSAHTAEEIINQVSLHESVHAYNSVLNKNMPLWLNEGLATYMAGQAPRGVDISKMPTIERMHTANPLTFSSMGGYTFAYLYIEYLDKTYGWDKVITLAKTLHYNETFGRGEAAIYHEWRNYLQGISTKKTDTPE